MISSSVGEIPAKSAALRAEDWSEVEALLAAPGETVLRPPTARRRSPRLAFGLIALAALGTGSVVLEAAKMPGCDGSACGTNVEVSTPTPPAIRDVAVLPTQIAQAEVLVTPQPILQGRSIAPAPRSQPRGLPRLGTLPPPKRVTASAPARGHAAPRVAAPIRRPLVAPRITRVAPPQRLAISARSMMARHPMRAMAARPMRLQRVFLSPHRYVLVERR